MSYLTDTVRMVCPILNGGKDTKKCNYDSELHDEIINGVIHTVIIGRCNLGCYGASKRIVTYDNARILLFLGGEV